MIRNKNKETKGVKEMKKLYISGKVFDVVRENYAEPVGDVAEFHVVKGPRGGEYCFWVYNNGIGVVWNARFTKAVAGQTRNFEIK